MYFLYIDESGSNTSHFVLLGIAIPVNTWRKKTLQISRIKKKYDLSNKEIHTGWVLKRILEQNQIPNFNKLSYEDRRIEVAKKQNKYLDKFAVLGNRKKVKAKKKEIKKLKDFIHLTYKERQSLIKELVKLVGSWNDMRLFSEVVERQRYNLETTMYENAFIQVISRFDNFLRKFSKNPGSNFHGTVVQDMNKEFASRLRDLMKVIHTKGTIWSRYTRIVETPFFVDSELTGMVQMADLCAYITRRFFENNETDLFDTIYYRFDRIPSGKLTGLRHYTGNRKCQCKVCLDHSGKNKTIASKA